MIPVDLPPRRRAGTRTRAAAALVAGLLVLAPRPGGAQWREAPRVPVPLSGSAVAGLDGPTGGAVFAFGGATPATNGPTVSGRAFRWDVATEAWAEIAPLPGTPRIGAAAQAVGSRIYVVGGATVDGSAPGRASDRVDIYDPRTGRWSVGSPTPVPVARAVSGVWRDSLLVLVSGRSGGGAVRTVQIYDPAADRWRTGTDFPGDPVAGHTGGVVRDAIIVVDGARVAAGDADPRLARQVWRGELDPSDPTRIRWRRLPDHPGSGLYGAGAVAVGSRLVVVGGSRRPHGVDGRGPGGREGEPVRDAWILDAPRAVWRGIEPPARIMDQGNVARAGGLLVVVGGMDDDRRASDRVWAAPLLPLVTGGGGDPDG